MSTAKNIRGTMSIFAAQCLHFLSADLHSFAVGRCWEKTRIEDAVIVAQ